jgi:hypothetical protein
MKRRLIIASCIILSQCAMVFAATSFDKAAWIPYWRKTEGASTTLAHLNELTQISPFSFELQSATGMISNALKIDQEPWTYAHFGSQKE